jgi:methoxymalonate biosynthesis acyl carrier protein
MTKAPAETYAVDEAVAAELTRFLAERTRRTCEPHDDLFGPVGLSSLFAMQLVVHLENTYGIEIRGADLRLDNFRTIRAMCALIARLRAAEAVAEDG